MSGWRPDEDHNLKSCSIAAQGDPDDPAYFEGTPPTTTGQFRGTHCDAEITVGAELDRSEPRCDGEGSLGR
jgi:hypothetical protein